MTAPSRMRRIVAFLGLSAALMVGATATASAATASTTSTANVSASGQNFTAERTALEHVLESSHPNAAYQALPASEKALVQQALTHQQVATVVSRTGRLSAAQQLAVGQVTPAASGCWYHYQYSVWSDLGIAEAHTWMQLNWCGNGSKITSWSVTDVGAQGLDGFSYDGIIGRWSNNVGWEIRYAIEFKFNIGPVIGEPCMQIRGGDSGLFSQNASCSVG